MGAKTIASLEEYLRTSYDGPEPDFVDGEVVPRAMPNNFHSETVDALIRVLIQQAPTSLFRRPELRIRVAPDRYRVADLAVFDYRPRQAEPGATPLIVIEVLSPDDSHAALMRKLADYAALGIPHVWLVDPVARRFSVFEDDSLISKPQLEIPAHGVLIRHSNIFLD